MSNQSINQLNQSINRIKWPRLHFIITELRIKRTYFIIPKRTSRVHIRKQIKNSKRSPFSVHKTQPLCSLHNSTRWRHTEKPQQGPRTSCSSSYLSWHGLLVKTYHSSLETQSLETPLFVNVEMKTSICKNNLAKIENIFLKLYRIRMVASRLIFFGSINIFRETINKSVSPLPRNEGT